MSEVDCPQCGGDGSGGNNEFACGLCNGVGSVTRPQPSAEPVAVWREAYTRFNATIAMTNEDGNQAAAAVIASALEAARREALEEAAAVVVPTMNKRGPFATYVVAAIRALQENPNG